MKFIHRLGYYLGGLSVGLIFLAFFLNGKRASCDYGPQARVLKNINSKPFVISNKAQTALEALDIDSVAFRSLIRKGRVNFSESQTHLDSCNIYIIEGEHNEKKISAEVKNCSKKALITKVF
jgi:hypothetical protein